MYDAIPKKWGVLIVNDDGTTHYRRKPLALEDKAEKDVPRGFLASLVRNVQDHQPAQKAISDAFWRGRSEGEESRRGHGDEKQQQFAHQSSLVSGCLLHHWLMLYLYFYEHMQYIF